MWSSSSSSSFAGESYLDADLPNYDNERWMLTISLVVIGVSSFVVLPVIVAGPSKQIGVLTQTLLNLSGLFAILWVILTQSSNSTWAARTVLEAPLLTDQECDRVLEIAHRVAAQNLRDIPISQKPKLHQFPMGWNKDRHTDYPTCDLNWVVDPFLEEEQQWLADKLHRRLSPVIERVYGVNPGAIRANDMFVVRYDATEEGEGGQRSLSKHTDSGHISFNILLNDQFQGGGTRFWNRLDLPNKIVAKPPRGSVLVNNAAMEHEGLATTKGTRYILVGFTNVDTMDPFTKEPTGLSVWASWLSLTWLQRRFDEGYDAIKKSPRQRWYYNRYTKSLFNDILKYAIRLGDIMGKHHLVKLVSPENRLQYLKALDSAPQNQRRQANWFTGQQILLDVDGTLAGYWQTRVDASTKFDNSYEI